MQTQGSSILNAPHAALSPKPASRHGLGKKRRKALSAPQDGLSELDLRQQQEEAEVITQADDVSSETLSTSEKLAPSEERTACAAELEQGFEVDDPAVDIASDGEHSNDLPSEPVPAIDISHEFVPGRLEEHRKALMRMARLRVRSHEWAEDAVQEALIAAYQSRGSYRGRGSVRSWLRGILDHKIHDRFRAECHYVQADWIDDDSSSAEEQLDWAARCGVMGQRTHEDPMEICSRRQRLKRVASSLEDMAPGMREAFVLQVVEDRPSLEVAGRLGISENNCWIRVHRARKKLMVHRDE